ncbi:MAG TPA: response regulator [Acidobacteriaceae bacterium]|nr:response regulator [Acidobacteriaceae bacterium]
MARILCVDDEAVAVRLKCAILERAGHTAISACSAEEAIAHLDAAVFDAVVTDWRLGEESGRAIVQAAKSHASMPVVVVSGFVSEAFRAAEPAADLYLEKPVNPDELLKIINALLGNEPKVIV